MWDKIIAANKRAKTYKPDAEIKEHNGNEKDVVLQEHKSKQGDNICHFMRITNRYGSFEFVFDEHIEMLLALSFLKSLMIEDNGLMAAEAIGLFRPRKS